MARRWAGVPTSRPAPAVYLGHVALIVLHPSVVETIGIRELRQHASRWVAKAKGGATIQITDRGQPVARLTPITASDTDRAALIAEGLLIPAARPRTPLNTDALIQGPPLSEILDEIRTDR